MEFRHSLTLSLLFKFNLEILQKLRDTVGDTAAALFFRYSWQRLTRRSRLQNVITDDLPKELQFQPLPTELQPSLQVFQVRKHL